MINRKTRRGIIGLSILAISTWYLSSNPEDQARNVVTKVDTRLNYSLSDFNAQLLDREGNINLQIDSPVLRSVARSNVATIESPVIQISQDDERWYITAESAIITADREYITLIGEVDMLRKNQLSGEELDIETRDVLLNVTPRTAQTDAPVSINQPGNQLNAIGMTLDMINDSFELKDEVRAHYEIP